MAKLNDQWKVQPHGELVDEAPAQALLRAAADFRQGPLPSLRA